MSPLLDPAVKIRFLYVVREVQDGIIWGENGDLIVFFNDAFTIAAEREGVGGKSGVEFSRLILDDNNTASLGVV